MSIELEDLLNSYRKNRKSLIDNFLLESMDVHTLLPSITSVGWPALLAFDSPLQYVYRNDTLSLSIIDNENNIVLNSPDSRSKRIQRYFSSIQNNLEPFELEQKNLPGSLNDLKNVLLKSKNTLIPFLWYRKFDDHSKTKKEFFSSVHNDLELLKDLIFQLHLLGFSKVFIFTDHGFLFANNSDILHDIPNMGINQRYCVSTTPLDQYNQSKYPEWYFWSLTNPDLGLSSDNNLTLILPKDSSIFKKLGQDERFTHGGLSFLECNIRFMVSTCQLIPRVQIASVELDDHETQPHTSGQETVILKEGKENYKILKLKITGSEPTTKGEKLKDLKLKIQIDHSDSKIDPSDLKSLKAGKLITCTISLRNILYEKEILVSFLDENNQIIKNQKFLVKVSPYEIGL